MKRRSDRGKRGSLVGSIGPWSSPRSSWTVPGSMPSYPIRRSWAGRKSPATLERRTETIWSSTWRHGKRGSADLSSYFLLRGARLLRDKGQLGFMATNTIAQGDTREVGLHQLLADGFVVPRAVSSQTWPGEATVYYAIVWLRRGNWASSCVLDDKSVLSINSFLSEPGVVSGPPHRLAANAGKSFQGSIVLGMGFIMEPEEATKLIEKNRRNKDVLFPYLTGEDLNSQPDKLPSRWVINFLDYPLSRDTAPVGYEGPVAADYPDCLAIVEEKVKPERIVNRFSKNARERWWQYERGRPELYRIIAGMKQVLVLSRITNYVQFEFTPSGQVFSDRLAVLPLTGFSEFAVLSSSLHYAWAWNYSVTNLSLLSYSPSDYFDTFPLPDKTTELEIVGLTCHMQRSKIMLVRGMGITKTYNLFHSNDCSERDIQELRGKHVEMDKAVSAAYGWSDLNLGHGFHETSPLKVV